MADKVKYLDLGGLTTYDGKIKGVIDSKVAAGVDAIPAMEITSVTQKDFASNGGNTDEFVISYKDNKGASKTTTFKINTPNAAPTTEDGYQYGLMSSQDKLNIQNNTNNLSELSSKVDGLVTAGGEPNKIDTISLNSKAVSFTVDAAKNADLTLDVDYDTTTKKVRLKSGNTILSSFDASAFIKDGMLNSAEIITVPSDGEEATVDRPAGKYIKLTWNTDAGKEATYIPVKDIIKEYTFAGSADGISLHSATRGNVKITDTLTATTDSDGTIRVKSGGSLADGSWFTKVDEELDAVPTTYAKAADVDTSLKAKADKTELPTVSANSSISIQDTLNYGDNSFAIDLDVTKTGVNNEVKLSESGFTTWVSAVDTQVKTNTDAIAGIPENFIVGDGFNYSYQTTYEDSHGDTHYNDYILSFVPNIEVVDENGVKKVKIGIINTSPNQVEEVGDTANYNLLDTWKDKLNNASMQGHTHVIADITDFDTITTDDIDALFA